MVEAAGSKTQRFAVAPSSMGPPWALWPARRASVTVRPAMPAGCVLISAKIRGGREQR